MLLLLSNTGQLDTARYEEKRYEERYKEKRYEERHEEKRREERYEEKRYEERYEVKGVERGRAGKERKRREVKGKEIQQVLRGEN